MDQGVRELSISAVCERAGITRTSFYNYFQSVDELIEILSESLAEDIERAFDELYGLKERGAERFAFTTRYLLESAVHYPRLARLMYRLLAQTGGIMPAYERRVALEVEAAIRHGDFSIQESEVATYVTVAAGSTNSAMRKISSGAQTDADITGIVTHLLRAGGMHEEKARKLGKEPLGVPPPPLPGWVGR